MTKGLDNRMVLDVRGWGEIQNLFDTLEESEAFQDELGEYFASAINMKIRVKNLKAKQLKNKQQNERIKIKRQANCHHGQATSYRHIYKA